MTDNTKINTNRKPWWNKFYISCLVIFLLAIGLYGYVYAERIGINLAAETPAEEKTTEIDKSDSEQLNEQHIVEEENSSYSIDIEETIDGDGIKIILEELKTHSHNQAQEETSIKEVLAKLEKLENLLSSENGESPSKLDLYSTASGGASFAVGLITILIAIILFLYFQSKQSLQEYLEKKVNERVAKWRKKQKKSEKKQAQDLENESEKMLSKSRDKALLISANSASNQSVYMYEHYKNVKEVLEEAISGKDSKPKLYDVDRKQNFYALKSAETFSTLALENLLSMNEKDGNTIERICMVRANLGYYKAFMTLDKNCPEDDLKDLRKEALELYSETKSYIENLFTQKRKVWANLRESMVLVNYVCHAVPSNKAELERTLYKNKVKRVLSYPPVLQDEKWIDEIAKKWDGLLNLEDDEKLYRKNMD